MTSFSIFRKTIFASLIVVGSGLTIGLAQSDVARNLPKGSPTEVLSERNELFMLAALAHVHQFSADAPKIGYNIWAVLAWNVDDIQKTPEFVFERNRNIEKQGEIFHAEGNTLRKAYTKLYNPSETFATNRKGGKLKDTTIYTTLEPCPMCSSTLLMAQVPLGYFCMEDPELRDVKTHVVTKHSLTTAYGRNLKIVGSGLTLCKGMNKKLWETIGDINAGKIAGTEDITVPDQSDKKKFFLLKYLASRENSIFKEPFDKFKNYKVRFVQNESLFQNLLKSLEQPAE